MSPRNRRKENPYRSPVMAGYYAVTPKGCCIVCADPLPLGRSRSVHPECYPEYQRLYSEARREIRRAENRHLAPIVGQLATLERLAAMAVKRAVRQLMGPPPRDNHGRFLPRGHP